MTTLRKLVEACPPGTLFTREGLLAAMPTQEREYERRLRMIGTGEAARLTGVEPAKLRRLAGKWERHQARDIDVPVRVSRKSSAPQSDFLFERDDCLSYRASRSGSAHLVMAEKQPETGLQKANWRRGPKHGRRSDRGAGSNVDAAPPVVEDEANAIADKLLQEHYGR